VFDAGVLHGRFKVNSRDSVNLTREVLETVLDRWRGGGG
jgi:hypothetical protein